MRLVGNINVEPLLKAFDQFERFRFHDQTEQERAGIIQAFEYTFELSWKIMKKVLEERGQLVNSPKEVFRMAALEGFIEDPEIWFDFLKKRNLTVHAYNQNYADEVLSVCGLFALEMQYFLKRVGISDVERPE